MLFLFLHVSFVSKFQQDTRLNVSISSHNYAECLQNEYDNWRDFNDKEMSIFDLPVDLTSKLHGISINLKFRFTLEKVTRGEYIIIAQDGSRS